MTCRSNLHDKQYVFTCFLDGLPNLAGSWLSKFLILIKHLYDFLASAIFFLFIGKVFGWFYISITQALGP